MSTRLIEASSLCLQDNLRDRSLPIRNQSGRFHNSTVEIGNRRGVDHRQPETSDIAPNRFSSRLNVLPDLELLKQRRKHPRRVVAAYRDHLRNWTNRQPLRLQSKPESGW
jgi:hypothetical protein